MTQTELVAQWVQSALGDLRVAEHELEFFDEEIVVSAVCFHCQQAVEKLLKAFLIEHQKNFPKTHSLEHLIVLCSELDAGFKDVDVGNLTEFSVETQYPDFLYPPTLADAKESLNLAVKAKDFILSKLQVL